MSFSCDLPSRDGLSYPGSTHLSRREPVTSRPLRTICSFLAVLTIGVTANAQDLTITNARIIGPNATVIERGSIVVRAGKIVSVTSGQPSPSTGKVIDAKGMSAMPGFIDAHRHFNTGPNEKAQM